MCFLSKEEAWYLVLCVVDLHRTRRKTLMISYDYDREKKIQIWSLRLKIILMLNT